MIAIKPERLLADLRELATIGAYKTGVDRVAFSDADIAARRWLVGKLRAAGLEASLDRVGNVLGRDPAALQAVLIGSHTDTVPKGGWLDGALGVVYGLEIARAARESGGAGLGVDVVSFQDEEGTYLSCLGSRSFLGDMTEADIAAASSKNGVLLARALESMAGEASPHRMDGTRHRCYLEAHIEQGPRLEAAGRRIAVVTGLVGIRRLRIRAYGRADHAGTTPMAMRQDAGAALVAFAGWVAGEFPKHAGPETVWNIGSMEFRPGAANVVPSEGDLVLEFRDTKAAVLDHLEALVTARVATRGGGGVRMELAPISRIPPADLSPELRAVIAEAARALGEEPMSFPSGAGHDAMYLAGVIPSAMLFVPSIGGRSHDISENTSDADIVFGAEVLAAAVSRLRERPERISRG